MRKQNHPSTFLRCLLGIAMFLPGAQAVAQSSSSAQATLEAKAPSVHFVWMGGNDCPPCVAWRAFELPKLSKAPEFQRIRFSYVTKTIGSPVPPAFFLPADVKPLKSLLDDASAGRAGSPQAAVIVDGVVFDYFYGTRSAEDIERMLIAIRTGSAYPFARCLKVTRAGRGCEVLAPS